MRIVGVTPPMKSQLNLQQQQQQQTWSKPKKNKDTTVSFEQLLKIAMER